MSLLENDLIVYIENPKYASKKNYKNSSKTLVKLQDTKLIYKICCASI